MSDLTRYDAMRTAIAACHSVDEVKEIVNKAAALQEYARQSKDPQMEREVAQIRLRARRRIGELSAALEKHEHRLNDRRRDDATPAKREVLSAAGISKDEAHRCEQIARVPLAAFETYIATKAAAGKVVTADEVVRMVVKRERKAGIVTVAEAATIKTADLSTLSTQLNDTWGLVVPQKVLWKEMPKGSMRGTTVRQRELKEVEA